MIDIILLNYVFPGILFLYSRIYTYFYPTSACGIQNIPDEILVKIILYFNARKRLALANSCRRFNRLVFEDNELLRELDFSKNGYLTTATDIQQYFGNEKTCKCVLKLNVQNVLCMRSGEMLNRTIGKATNLVDINIHGIKFEVMEELASFLEPLVHVKRLSIDWPDLKTYDIPISSKVLLKALGKLVYFSVRVYKVTPILLPSIQLCHELNELRIETRNFLVFTWQDIFVFRVEPKLPKDLQILRINGESANAIYRDMLVIYPHLQEWTDFQLMRTFGEPLYLEKHVEVCEELRKTRLTKNTSSYYPYLKDECGVLVIPQYLLIEVITITHEDAPGQFCCLPPYRRRFDKSCGLKIDEAKQLLKDPGYQISFLHFNHNIERDCDAHLVASAFPNLTTLIFSHTITGNGTVGTPRRRKDFKRRLRKRGSTAPEEQNDSAHLDSSFKMLVENTPNVKDLTIDSILRFDSWDDDAVYLIPRWKHLRTLRLVRISIRDTDFLVEIGKQCPQLEKIVLNLLINEIGFDSCVYTGSLSQMLSHCQNLREFSIKSDYTNLGGGYKVPEVLTSLSRNSKLRKVCLMTDDISHTSANLVSSFKQLLQGCPKLTTLLLIIRGCPNPGELATTLESIIDELNRPNFQFQGPELNMRRIANEDVLPFFFPLIDNQF